MSRAVLRQMEGQAKPPDAEFIWISTIPDAVLALAETKQRQLKKWAKRGSGGRPGIPSNKGVYEMLNDSVAVDLVWLCERLPRHILDTLVDERVPAEAAKLSVRRTSEHGGGRWVAYLTHAVRLLANLAQLGSEFSELSQALNHGGRGSPALLVDSLLLAQSVALATRFPNPDGEDAWTDTEGNDDGAGDEAATPGEGAAAAGEEEAGEEGAGCGPLDLLAQAYRALASLLRGDHREIGGAKSESLLGPVGQALVAHSKVREAVAEGLMDGMAAFFFEMERDCDRQRRKEMVWAVASAVDILVFCTWDKGFVAELVVSEQMRNGASLSVLKKVLQMPAPDLVGNLLRWLLVFCEYEDPPTVDILAGYDLYNRFLLSVLERNNAAMVAWTAKAAFNPLACDLMRAVEIFADDSTFKARVIDSCTEAVATVMKRAPEVNGFTKVDSMHLPFTRAYFKLVAALHCFNPDVMPPEQEHQFAHALVEEARSEAELAAMHATLQHLGTLPDLLRRAKDSEGIEAVTEEDLGLVVDLRRVLDVYYKARQRKGTVAKGKAKAAPKGRGGAAGGAPQASPKGGAKVSVDVAFAAAPKGGPSPKGGGPSPKTGGKGAGSKRPGPDSASKDTEKGKKGKPEGRRRMTEEEQILQAMEASKAEQ